MNDTMYLFPDNVVDMVQPDLVQSLQKDRVVYLYPGEVDVDFLNYEVGM